MKYQQYALLYGVLVHNWIIFSCAKFVTHIAQEDNNNIFNVFIDISVKAIPSN